MLKTASKLVSADQIITPISFSGDVTLSNGNLVIGTSGKGIDFSATPGTGTSELLSDYEEGTWTPADASGAGLTLTVNQATYTKVGRLVNAQLYITYPATVDASGAAISLPFTPAALFQQVAVVYTNSSATMAAINSGNNFLSLYAGASPLSNGAMSGNYIIFSILYTV